MLEIYPEIKEEWIMEKQSSDDQPWLLERRAFLKMGASFGLLLMGWADPVKAALFGESQGADPRITPRSSARNCLLIVLRGGPSHVDTFDIKVGSWTPKALGVEKLPSGISWPVAIMPGLAQRVDKFAIVRTL